MAADRNTAGGFPLLFSLDVKLVNVFRKRILVTRHPSGRSGAQTLAGARNFPVPKKCRQALVPTQPCIQSVPGAISPRMGRPGREADHSPPEVFWWYFPVPTDTWHDSTTKHAVTFVHTLSNS
jgi:hypothetical protein